MAALTRKFPQHKVDEFRQNRMTEDQRNEFDELCRWNKNITDLWNILLEMGYDGSLMSVQRWRKHNYPTGQQAQIIHNLCTQYDQLNGQIIADFTLGKLTEIFMLLTEESIDLISRTDALRLIPAYAREIRAFSESVADRSYKKTGEEIAMAAVEEALQEFQLIYQDTAMESSIQEATKAVRKRLEQRWLINQ